MKQEAQWLSEITSQFNKSSLVYRHEKHQLDEFSITNEHWLKAAESLHALECRFSGLWADSYKNEAKVYAFFCFKGHFFLLHYKMEQIPYSLPSITSVYPAANRFERHVRDLMGITFTDSPDNRRWIRHLAWKDKEFPLDETFPLKREVSKMTHGDNRYPFFQTQGIGVSEVPVGPIHAGIIEPGHFRFQIMGETVLNLEERLGYTHKGIEKIAVGKTPQALLKLAARVSGDSAVCHAWSAAMAIETIADLQLPKRALHLRAILLERERVANHIGDIGAICNDVGFAFAHHQTARMRELWQRTHANVYQHRLLMDTIIIGGVAHDLSALQVDEMLLEIATLKQDFNQFVEIIQDYPSLEDRLATTGYLPPETAKALGCLGYVGRASGQCFDVRRDAPFAPYHDFSIPPLAFQAGDALSRLQVRVDEVRVAFTLLERLLASLPKGDIQTEVSKITTKGRGIGMVAGWRGETFAFIRLDNDGNVARYFPRDPSWLNWPALEALIDNNIVADFPVCNKSVNGSYSGVDL